VRKRFSAISIAFLGLACSQPLSPAADRVPPENPGRAYIGTWQIAFALDATRDPAGGPGGWRAAADRAQRVTGRLTVRDSVVDPEHQILAAT
jgi:hypothetical protein